ncbi:unnamed protein product [Malus baccata var. baccata]
MDEEMVEFVREAFEGGEIDMDYEFDAPKFYDFTRPETGREGEEAEEWLRSAGGYQPSRSGCPPFLSTFFFFIIFYSQKLATWPHTPTKNFAEPKDVEEDEVIRCIDSNNCMEAEVSAVVDDNIRVVSYCHVLWCFNTIRTPYSHGSRHSNTKPKSQGKSPPLSRSSTLMKPTASQLAKQNHCREVHSNRLLRRMAKKLRKLDEKSQNSPQPMKRQKLEAGCVRKVAEQLKHQPLWLHKVGADAARPKVTVLKEPNLETSNRAQRRKYKVNAKPGEESKIHRAPPWPSPKKSTIPATEFQMFRLRTSARVMQQTYDHHANSAHALKQEKSGMVYKCVDCSLKNKEFKFAIDKRYLKEPPTDSFSKLFPGSEEQHNTKPQSKSAFAC